MGREIVRRESPENPGNRSRIWDNKDSLHVLRKKSGTAKIRGLILNIQKFENRNRDGNRKRKFQDAFNKSFVRNIGNWVTSTTSRNLCEVALETEAFAMMCNLKFFMINYMQLNGSYKTFPKELRWLCWHGSPLQSIPGDFCLERLVILEMPYSSLRSVWTGAKFARLLHTPYQTGGSYFELMHRASFNYKASNGELRNLEVQECPLLEKVEPIENVDEEIINNLCLSNWEYLETTNIKIYQYRASCVRFYNSQKVGPSVNQQCYSIYRGGSRHRIVIMVIWRIWSLIYFPHIFREVRFQNDNGFAGSYPFRTYVTNCSRRTIFHNGDRWFSGVSKTSQDMIDLSYWKFKHDELKCGDVLFIKVQEEEFGRRIKLKVKEIGVRILFSEHEEKSLQYVSREEFQEISTITLCHSFSTTKSLNIPLQVGYLIEHSFQRHLTEYHLESEVPRWCEFRSRGPSIELPMPLYQDSLSGLQVCVIYTLLHHYQDIYYHDGEGTSINNKSTDGFWNNMYKWVIGDTKLLKI
ncbi:hypothetical protein NMG60_11032431 [Bertholletia excelsa]